MNVRDIKEVDFLRLDKAQDKAKFMLQYAILAPSTHNSQPWLFRVTENICEVFLDPYLSLPYADPKGRDIHISIGCAIENLTIATKYHGFFGSVTFGPFKEANKIAELHFKDSEKIKRHKPLIHEIMRWVNSRGVFRKEDIGKHVIENVLQSANLSSISTDVSITSITDRKIIERLARLTAKGLRIAHSNPPFRKEMSRWMNSSFSLRHQGIPGYALGIPAALSLVIPTLIGHFDLSKFLAEKNYKSMASAPIVTILSLREETYQKWVQVGRVAQRLMLEWHANSYNTSIFVAAIEMGGLYKEVKQYLVNKTHVPQFLFAVGHIDSFYRQTPRHPLEKKLML